MYVLCKYACLSRLFNPFQLTTKLTLSTISGDNNLLTVILPDNRVYKNWFNYSRISIDMKPSSVLWITQTLLRYSSFSNKKMLVNNYVH